MLLAPVPARADVTIDDAAKALPDKLASFRAQGPAQMPMRDILEIVSAKEVGAISSAARTYANDKGATIAADSHSIQHRRHEARFCREGKHPFSKPRCFLQRREPCRGGESPRQHCKSRVVA